MNLVPGGGEALMAGLDGAVFFAGNNFNRAATMELKVEVPALLSKKGWRLELANTKNTFRLKPGEKRKIELKLAAGAEFTSNEIRNVADRNFNVALYGNGMLIGEMTYQVDPDLLKPPPIKDRPGTQCKDAAQDLLDCLKLPGKQKVKKVCVTRVSVDIALDNDCDCD